MKTAIQQNFNKHAMTYDDSAFLQSKVGHKLSKKLPDTARCILEIGCGTGLFSQHLINLYPNANIVLTDIAPNMISQSQKRLGDHSNVIFQCIDGEKLTLEKKYDLIVSNMSLHWFTQYSKSFEKIIDLLIPKGHFIFAMVGENSLSEWQTIYEKYNYPVSTPVFPSRDKLEELFPFHSLTSELITLKYDDAYHFLSSLKKIGATTAREETTPLSPIKLRKILREYSKELSMTYEIIYGHYIKK